MKRWKNTDNTPVVLLLRSLPPVNIVNVCCPSNNLTFPRLMQCFLRLSVYIEALYGNNCLSALFHYVKNSLSSMKPKLAYISLLKPVLSLWSIGSCLSDFSRVYRRQTVIWKSSQISWKANFWGFHWAESFKCFKISATCPYFIVSQHWHYVLRTRTEYCHQKNGDYDSLYEDIMRSL